MDTSNDTGNQEPQNPEGDKTPEQNDEEVNLDELDLDDETKQKLDKRFKTLDAQRANWREKAIDPDTGKPYRDLMKERKDQTSEGDKTPKNDKDKKQTNELDWGQKAYLRAEGIKTKEETELVQNIMNETGKNLDEVLESKYFQAELKEVREQTQADNAVPSDSKRSGNQARDSVEYWVAKGELPPADQVELRRKVVNARMKQKKDSGMFTDTPVVGS